MLKVICGNNLKRTEFRVSGNTIISPDGNQNTMPHDVTLKDVLTAAGVDYTRGAMHLDGATLGAGDLNKTFAAFGLTDGKCFLLNVVKADNA